MPHFGQDLEQCMTGLSSLRKSQNMTWRVFWESHNRRSTFLKALPLRTRLSFRELVHPFPVALPKLGISRIIHMLLEELNQIYRPSFFREINFTNIFVKVKITIYTQQLYYMFYFLITHHIHQTQQKSE